MTSCVLDTDVVIAVLERTDAHHAAAAEALRTLIADGMDRRMSVVNYAEALVRPAQGDATLRAAAAAIAALGIEIDAPTPAIARNAARLRGAGISLADGFALATAAARGATVASFDERVRRALGPAGLRLAPQLSSRS